MKRVRYLNLRSAGMIVGIGFVLIMLSACVSQSPPPAVSAPVIPFDPMDQLLTEAKQAFEQQELEQALGKLSDYLSRSPQGRKTDEALFLMADIYRQQGHSEAAEAFFRRLYVEFPDSPYADKSRLAVIDLQMAGGRIDEAHELAIQLLQRPITKELRNSVQQRLFQVFNAQGDHGNAGLLAFVLYRESSGPEKRQWADRFAEISAQMTRDEIETFWDKVDDPDLRSYLIYRLAVIEVMEEHYDAGLEMFTLFQQRYPQHPFAEEAAKLIEALSQRLAFQPFTLGCLLPLSGPYAPYGLRALNGVELALSTLQGTETSLPFKLVIKDTASDEARTVQAVRELVEAGAGAIIGPIILAPVAAVEAQRLQIPMVAITQKSDITAIGNYIFRHFITPQNQVHTLVDYFINTIGLTEFAVMYPRETYGDAFLNYFWDEIIHQGGHVVGVEAYEADQTDFAVPIKKLVGAYYPVSPDLELSPVVRKEESPYFLNTSESKDRLEDFLPDPVARLAGLFSQTPDQDRVKGPAIGRISQDDDIDPIVDFDVLFIPDAPKAAGLIIPQLAFYNIKDIYLAGTNLWHSPQLIEMSKDYLRNAVMVDGFFKDSQSDTVHRFVDNFQHIYGQEPGIIEAFAFDTAKMLFDVLAQPHMRMRQQVRIALVNAFREDGVTGPTAFDASGEPIKRLSLLRIEGGRFTEIRHP